MLMAAEGLNPNSLAAATRGKTKQPQIHRFITGASLEPKRSTLEPVAAYFGIPVDAFFDARAADNAWRTRAAAGLIEARPLGHDSPIATSAAVTPAEAFAVVAQALVGLPATQWAMVRGALDQLVAHPESIDDVVSAVAPMLTPAQAAPGKRQGNGR